ncbi:hypothetical protein ARMSODRAFT_117217 [Armillaria solidipes]|uniref:Uncharacterized protein n=1 Tax=Armillaria solidipes TaxID=1076256 RepID=A0A2H3AUI7_9AGAR|nr:hypothetical protein ARMSODRAFT_117217 [Armillaria solidipes]
MPDCHIPTLPISLFRSRRSKECYFDCFASAMSPGVCRGHLSSPVLLTWRWRYIWFRSCSAPICSICPYSRSVFPQRLTKETRFLAVIFILFLPHLYRFPHEQTEEDEERELGARRSHVFFSV